MTVYEEYLFRTIRYVEMGVLPPGNIHDAHDDLYEAYIYVIDEEDYETAQKIYNMLQLLKQIQILLWTTNKLQKTKSSSYDVILKQQSKKEKKPMN